MKKLIYILLFLPVLGFGQVNPWQIEPDTTHRMIMMTDTSVIDSPALEFVYSSIDSLVRQITKDSLGLDSTYWSLDDSLSLSPINQTNNIILGNLSGNTSLTGSYNFIGGNGLGNNLTTGSYNFLINGGNSLTTASNNSFIGEQSGYYQTGSNNIGIGYRALYGQSGLSTGSNIGIGINAGYNLTNTSGSIFIGSSAGRLLDENFSVGIGSLAVEQSAATEPAAIGVSSGQYSSGIRPLFFGNRAGRYSTGDYPVYLGYQAGHSSGGDYNTAINYNAGYYQGGSYNVFIGREAGYGVNGSSTGNHGIGIGYRALYSITTGGNNIGIGREAGFSLTTGTGNILLGYQAGYNETGSNKLYIENSNSATPLIYGDFANDTVRINGNLEVTNKTGTAGNLAGFDGDQIVDSGIDASSVLTSETDEFGAMDFYNVGSTYFFRAEDDLGNGLGDAMSLTPGTNISFVNTGNNLTISATGSTQTLSKSGGEVSLSGGGGSVEVHTVLSGGDVVIVDDLNFTADVVMGDIDITSRGTTPTSIIGRDANGWVTTVGTGAGISLSGGNIINTEISKWDDLGTYIEPSNNEAIRVSDGLQDAGGSSGGSGDVLISTGASDVDWWDKGIARGYEGTDNTTSASYVTWPPNSNYDSPVSDGSLTISGKTITASEAGWYRITVSGENQSTGQCNGAIYTTSAVYSQTIGTGHDNGASYTPASFSMHWIGSYSASTSFTFRVYATSGSCILDDVVFSVEQIKKN